MKENKAKGLNSGDLKIKDDSKDSSKRNEAPAKGGKPGAVVPASVRSRPWRESVGPRPAKDLSEEAAAAAADKGVRLVFLFRYLLLLTPSLKTIKFSVTKITSYQSQWRL